MFTTMPSVHHVSTIGITVSEEWGHFNVLCLLLFLIWARLPETLWVVVLLGFFLVCVRLSMYWGGGSEHASLMGSQDRNHSSGHVFRVQVLLPKSHHPVEAS